MDYREPDLGELYDLLEEHPIPMCVDNMAAFVGKYMPGQEIDTNRLYGHGEYWGFAAPKIKEAVCQLVDEGLLIPTRSPKKFIVGGGRQETAS